MRPIRAEPGERRTVGGIGAAAGLLRGLDQGAVDVIGSDHAPHTLVDLAAKWRILDQEKANQSGRTPFHDSEVTGRPMATIIRGLVAMREGDLAA